ncbi:MAG: MFS transporter [Chloroflexota bacterium]|nr:MFS transporter [Chloroflexota bacterium]
MKLSLLSQIQDKPSYRWWIYAAIAVGTFITVVEQSATSIVVPSIAEHFGADIPTAQWMAIAYMLSVSALMMPAGAIADSIGRKRSWVWGLLVFGCATFLTGLSQEFWMVLLGKIFMGVGASALQANGMAMVASSFPDDERGKALGLHMTIVGLGAIGGPVIGGIIDSYFGWRAIFFFITIVGIIAMFVAMIVLTPDDKKSTEKGEGISSFDWLGTMLSALFLLSLMLSITFLNKLTLSSPYIILGFLCSILLFVGFLLREKTTNNPMLPLNLFKSVSFSLGSSSRFISFAAGSSTFFLMPFYLVSGLGLTTAMAALYLLPGAIALAIFGPISGRLADKVGTTIPSVIGMAFSSLAMYLFSEVSLNSPLVLVGIASGLSGMGMSIFMAPNTSAIMGSAGRNRYGIVSAFLNLTRNGAHVVGIAIPTAIVVSVMAGLGYEADLSDAEKLKDVGLRTAYATAMGRAFQLSTVLMIFAGLLVVIEWFLNKYKSQTQPLR